MSGKVAKLPANQVNGPLMLPRLLIPNLTASHDYPRIFFDLSDIGELNNTGSERVRDT